MTVVPAGMAAPEALRARAGRTRPGQGAEVRAAGRGAATSLDGLIAHLRRAADLAAASGGASG